MEAAEIAVKLILTATILIDAILFLFVFRKCKVSALFTLLLIHLGGILGWSASILMVLAGGGSFWAYSCFAFPIVLALSKFLFVLSFPEGSLPPRSIHYLLMLPAVALLPLSFVPGAFFHEFSIIDNYYIRSDNGTYALPYSLFITYLLVYPIIVLIRKYRSGMYPPHTREQLKYLSIGTSIFFVIGLLTNSILPVFFDIYFLNGLGPSFSLVLAALIIYIISRHQFLEIRTALQRGFVFTMVLTCVIGLYVGTLMLLNLLLEHLTETAIIVSAGVTTVIGIFTVPHIDAFLRRKTDYLFFKNRYDYADALYTLSKEVNTRIEARDIITLTEESLREILRAESVKVSFSQETPANVLPHGETLTVPIELNGNMIGTILLGGKQSGDPYTEKDAVLVKTFSHQVAVAFEKARLYEEVKAYSRELEARVTERTKEVIRLKEAETQMMLDIAHKLQNPLTILKSEVEALRKSTSDSGELFFLEKTIDDTSAFIYDLLHLARLEMQPHEEDRENLNLSDHLTELTEYFTVMAEQRGVAFTAHIEPDVWMQANATKITELVTNLVSNAMKYSTVPGRDAAVSLTLTTEVSNITFTVHDNGVGIPQEDIPHIFDRFYRTKTTRSIEGTGLGLAISKKIVEMHGGTITATSETGHGTTFTVSFPV